MGAEKIQQIVWQVIKDCPGAYNLHDELRMSHGEVFSELDLNMTFHKIELHTDSRNINTFSTPNGLYIYIYISAFFLAQTWRQNGSRKLCGR